MLEKYDKIRQFIDKEAVSHAPRVAKMDGREKEDSVSASVTSKLEESEVQSASNVDQSEDVHVNVDVDDKKVKNKKEYNEPLADELLKPLKIMHRIINQNFYSKEQIIFKN
mmetsp:Transcript_60270/g.51056  ORF Transcript_60270/g.51056 Transcript_60270/m.51056 type:complete len:111 (-) Transcript_60270:1503-1835(-)